MSELLTIRLDAGQAERVLGQLLARARVLAPLMADVGEALTESTQDRFRTGIAPDGTAWLPLRDGSGRTPLLDTGAMRDSISPDSGADWVEIQAAAKQAPWHQLGTGPYLILPVNGKALKFGDTFAAKVNHPGLPARPFLGLSLADEQLIQALAAEYLAEG